MPAPPRLLIVAATRSDILHVAPLMREIGRFQRYALPFDTRLLVTRQEDTELDQAMIAFGLEADDDLGIKTPRLADAALGAKLLECMEQSLRKHTPDVVLTVGYSASAWATAVACYFKSIPLIHLCAGEVSPALDLSPKPFPEWLHSREIAGKAALHLACDDTAAAQLAGTTLPEARVSSVGQMPDLLIKESLEGDFEEDPALDDVAPERERVLVFLRRREHHANAARPLCMALNRLSRDYPETLFFCPFSLQSHICDALDSLIKPSENLRVSAPLPFGAFVREVSRSRLVVTDSNGVAREALLFGRQVLLLGPEALTESLEKLAAQSKGTLQFVDMDEQALCDRVSQALSRPSPPAGELPDDLDCDAGRRALKAIREWWD